MPASSIEVKNTSTEAAEHFFKQASRRAGAQSLSGNSVYLGFVGPPLVAGPDWGSPAPDTFIVKGAEPPITVCAPKTLRPVTSMAGAFTTLTVNGAEAPK